MQHFKKPTSASHCTPETTLRFILNLLIVVALLAATSIALDSYAEGAPSAGHHGTEPPVSASQMIQHPETESGR
ncbi:hypothetical protein [Saccharopolyspora sp. NPDC049426]|uniref:hypothetical protein n=1 Tax=unclassified Saccharopolyspora TaxID=2646250 RepID=UPI0032462918